MKNLSCCLTQHFAHGFDQGTLFSPKIYQLRTRCPGWWSPSASSWNAGPRFPVQDQALHVGTWATEEAKRNERVAISWAGPGSPRCCGLWGRCSLNPCFLAPLSPFFKTKLQPCPCSPLAPLPPSVIWTATGGHLWLPSITGFTFFAVITSISEQWPQLPYTLRAETSGRQF